MTLSSSLCAQYGSSSAEVDADRAQDERITLQALLNGIATLLTGEQMTTGQEQSLYFFFSASPTDIRFLEALVFASQRSSVARASSSKGIRSGS
jgi:hypothetical protein